jgi:hypothetical protein
MADVLPSQLVTSIMGKLYDVLTNGDETVPHSEDNFFTWASPGIPVDEADFDFLSQGLTGVVKKAAIAETVGVTPGAGGPEGAQPAGSMELTPALLDQLRAEDAARLYMQAENLARMVDFVPDVTSATNEQFARLNILNNEGSLSDIYRYVLRMSQVARTELPADTKATIERFRKLLTVTTTKKNLVDQSETEVSGPSPLAQAYFEKMAAYESAALEYNNRRIDALTASDPRAVHNWAMNANILRNRVNHAKNDWISNGYKNDYEQIAAFIDQVMQRDMSMLKEEYRDELEKARLTGLASGSDFFYTSLIPGNFAKSKGWTEFRFTSADVATHTSSNYSSKRWQAKAGGGFLGVFGAGGMGNKVTSSSRTEYKNSFNSAHVGLSFEIAQMPICRPWFKPAFLLSRSWRFDQGNAEVRDEIVSDGLTPPKGLMPAYPTSVVFIRNLKLRVGKASGFGDFVSEHTSASSGGQGYVSIGPFHAGGAYNRATTGGNTQRNHQQHWDGQELIVPGMQVIGYKCHIMPASPTPLPTIQVWI